MRLNSFITVYIKMYIIMILLFVLWTDPCDSAPQISLLSSHCQNSQHHYVRDHLDCSIFYVCFRGRAWKMRCSPGTVWSTRYKVCVWDSSAYDDCFEENIIPDPPQKQKLPLKPQGKPTTHPPVRWGRPIYTPSPPRKTLEPVVLKTTQKPTTTSLKTRTTKVSKKISAATTKLPMFFPWTTRPAFTPRTTRRPQQLRTTTKRPSTKSTTSATTTLKPLVTTRRRPIYTQWPRRTKPWKIPRTKRPWHRFTRKPWRTRRPRPKTQKPTRSPPTRRTTQKSWFFTRRTRKPRTRATTTRRPTKSTTRSTKPPTTTRRPTTTTHRPTTTTPRPTTTTHRPTTTTRRPTTTTRRPTTTTRRPTTTTARPTTTTPRITTTTPQPTTTTHATKRLPRTQKVSGSTTRSFWRTTRRPIYTPRKTWPQQTTTRRIRPTTSSPVDPTTSKSIFTRPTWNWWSRRVTKRPVTRPTRRRTTPTTTTLRTTTLPPTTTRKTTTRRTTTRRTTTRRTTTQRSTKRTYPPWRYPPDQCGVVASTMIIGGQPTGPGRWPWQVSLQIIAAADPWHRCGGVLVDPNWVLTAAHCVEGPFYGNARNWRVVLSEDDLNRSSGREVYRRISRIVSHPGYLRASNFPNDIALLQLDDPVDVTGRYVRHACLPDRDFSLGKDWNCWISGWGETRGTSRRFVLNELEVPILDNKNCSNMWARVGIPVLSTQVCVGNGEMGACYGDSGGPLMCEVDGVYVLGGVMSWLINNCTARNFPNVFTRVSSYIDWIYYNMDVYNFRRYS